MESGPIPIGCSSLLGPLQVNYRPAEGTEAPPWRRRPGVSRHVAAAGDQATADVTSPAH